MKIAIVAPSPMPFVMGGAEHLWLGLQRYINECTSHYCELFKTPTAETSLAEIVASYRLHARSDLDAFDLVISTKYPAWMVKHPRHVVYLQHTLRGLYDTYHFSGQPETVDWAGLGLDALRQEWLAIPAGDDLQLLDAIERAIASGRVSPEAARFPGPLARWIVQRLDERAMAPHRVRSYMAISQTVRKRAGYFPVGADVGVVYHPPRLQGFYCASGQHLFTTSRLDGPKRIGLLIEAMRLCKTQVPLLIGGTGPDESRLRILAGDDPRIQFLGHLTDQEVLDAYAHAIAVPFVPYEEDYGLITIEAMMSGKPVITTHDAGGVTEFVTHGKTGLSVAPEPEALASAIDALCSDRDSARAMGEAARQRVSGIEWHGLAERLLGSREPRPRIRHLLPGGARQRRPKLVTALTFPVFPPRGGGQARVFHLYAQLARQMDVVIISLAAVDSEPLHQEIAPGLREIRIPKSQAHQTAEDDYSRRVDWTPVTDIVAARLVHHTPAFTSTLAAECEDADVVLASHPYFSSTLRAAAPQAALWFDAHNVELQLKRALLPPGHAADELLAMVAADEQQAWRESTLVFACTTDDLASLAQAYGPTAALCIEAPNGFSSSEVQFVNGKARSLAKSRLELPEQPLVLFMGSWHGPNLDAVERIFGYAQALPDVLFAIVGSAGEKFRHAPMPDNVVLLGAVDEAEKEVLLSAADLAINPMTSGSGSNLKMLDYFASGVPVLSTPFGARGFAIQGGVHYLQASIEDFLAALIRHVVELPDVATMCRAANDLARSRYSWDAIGTSLLRTIQTSVMR